MFKNESRFPFLETKNHSKFTTLQKKYIALIINQYKLLDTTFYLNIKKIVNNSNLPKKYDDFVRTPIVAFKH